MLLKSLQLQNIRRHASFTLHLSDETTAILGDNALGKTTLAEAIYFIATGDSFRASVVDEAISFDAELGRIKAEIDHADERTTLELILTKGLVQGKKTAKRLFSVNGVRRRKKDFVGALTAVIFRPEDMRLVEGSPSRRRAFIDAPISLVNSQYAQSLATYEQTLVRRNKLLQQVREGEQPQTVLHYWNTSLLKHGSYIQQERSKFFQAFVLLEFPVLFTVNYKPSIISEERQAEYKEKELAAGRTLIGPHKDDFEVILHQWRGVDMEELLTNDQEFSVAVYGSRGQQRLAVLWLKLCELQFIEQTQKEKPLLVLDDILSELDKESKDIVIKVLNNYQSVVTTTQESDLEILDTLIDKEVKKVVL